MNHTVKVIFAKIMKLLSKIYHPSGPPLRSLSFTSSSYSFPNSGSAKDERKKLLFDFVNGKNRVLFRTFSLNRGLHRMANIKPHNPAVLAITTPATTSIHICTNRKGMFV